MPGSEKLNGAEEGALWTILRKAGGIQHKREIPERHLDPKILAELKRLVRA